MSHITVAASGRAFQLLFNAVRDNFKLSSSDSGKFSGFTANYSVALHLAGGSLSLNDDNSIEVKDMDVVWDSLTVGVCFTLGQVCVGGFCIVPDPTDGCLVRAPQYCIGGPVCIQPDLSGQVTSEITDLKARLVPLYFNNPLRKPTDSDVDAEIAGHSNRWQIFIDPLNVDVSPVDVSATAGSLFEKAVNDAIDNLMSSFPQWAKDLIKAILGPIVDVIKSALNIAGDINEFLDDLLGNQFGLLAIIETAVAQYFARNNPIYDFEDPFQILDPSAANNPIPVKIPIRNLAVNINSKEMVVTADVGA